MQHKRAESKGRTAKRQPISGHHLFPAVVALWFGALLGLGSLAIRASLLEGLVMKTRIDLIVPAAAPPLGVTARMLIALVMAAAGAVIGLIVARRIARPKPDARQRKRGARQDHAEPDRRDSFGRPGAPTPISVHDEIGSDEDGGAVLAGRRRAALAIEPESDDFVPHELAPLPGGAPQVLGSAGIDPAAPQPPSAPAPQAAPLDLGAYAEPAPAPSAPQPDAAPPPFAAPAGHVPIERQIFQPLPVAGAPAAQAESAIPPRQIFGMSIEDDHVGPAVPHAAGFPAAADPAEPPLAPRAMPDPLPAQPADVASMTAEPSGPLAGLGLIALAARLKLSIQARRAVRAAAAEAAAALEAAAIAPAGITPAPAMPALPDAASLLSPAPAHAAPDPLVKVPPAPLAMPAALRPLNLDDHGEDDDMLASLLPPRRIAMPENAARGDEPAAPDEPAPFPGLEASFRLARSPVTEPAADPAQEENYASLLDIGQPLATRSQFVRVDEPESDEAEIEPVVIFPGQTPLATRLAAPDQPAAEVSAFRRFDAPSAAGSGGPVAVPGAPPVADPAAAEQALRAALANLQRMSGAA